MPVRTHKLENSFAKPRRSRQRISNTNHNLGEFYVQCWKARGCRALFLERHSEFKDVLPTGQHYDLQWPIILAVAAEARQGGQSLLEKKNTGELQNLLGRSKRKTDKFLVGE